jgi:inward rectifier potassium channel
MSEAPRPVSLIRGPRSRRGAIIKGQDAGRFMDFYHGVLTASWPGFVAQLGALFLLINLVFAILYVTDRGGITNARPGNFADAFFFSVQTLGTLGYGVMAPKTLYTNILVTAESFAGILIIALFAGMIFARFSRPFARVLFSRNAVVTQFDGMPMLMFRAANQRGNSILDATAAVSLARNYTTREGFNMRRFQELKLVRGSNPLFALSWTVMHPIDEASPLYNLGLAEMIEHDMEIVVMLSGMDETIADRIYARYSYVPEEILWHRRFVDVISVTSTGRRVVDLVHFNDTEAFVAEPGREPDGGAV